MYVYIRIFMYMYASPQNILNTDAAWGNGNDNIELEILYNMYSNGIVTAINLQEFLGGFVHNRISVRHEPSHGGTLWFTSHQSPGGASVKINANLSEYKFYQRNAIKIKNKPTTTTTAFF